MQIWRWIAGRSSRWDVLISFCPAGHSKGLHVRCSTFVWFPRGRADLYGASGREGISWYRRLLKVFPDKPGRAQTIGDNRELLNTAAAVHKISYAAVSQLAHSYSKSATAEVRSWKPQLLRFASAPAVTTKSQIRDRLQWAVAICSWPWHPACRSWIDLRSWSGARCRAAAHLTICWRRRRRTASRLTTGPWTTKLTPAPASGSHGKLPCWASNTETLPLTSRTPHQPLRRIFHVRRWCEARPTRCLTLPRAVLSRCRPPICCRPARQACSTRCIASSWARALASKATTTISGLGPPKSRAMKATSGLNSSSSTPFKLSSTPAATASYRFARHYPLHALPFIFCNPLPCLHQTHMHMHTVPHWRKSIPAVVLRGSTSGSGKRAGRQPKAPQAHLPRANNLRNRPGSCHRASHPLPAPQLGAFAHQRGRRAAQASHIASAPRWETRGSERQIFPRSSVLPQFGILVYINRCLYGRDLLWGGS